MAEDLNILYNQTIENQRAYLTKLQEAFNRHCDQITGEAEMKLKDVPEDQPEARQQIFEEQKKKLNEALTHLRGEIDRSGRDTRQKLEEINRQREAQKLDELELLMQKA